MAEVCMAAGKQKREESQARRNALAAVDLWYKRRVYLGRAKIRPKGENPKPVPDVPDEYLHPETFIGPSTARPDGVTAWGVESTPGGCSHAPHGRGISLEVVNRDEAEQRRRTELARSEALAITEKAMLRLGLIDTRYFLAVEMSAAGYGLGPISSALGVSKPTAQMFVECGLTWIAGCLIVKPDFSAGMRAGDL